MNLLEDYREGFTFVFKDAKTGEFKKGKKFHYFRNGVSLCGKYVITDNKSLMSGGLFEHDICKICLQKLREERRV